MFEDKTYDGIKNEMLNNCDLPIAKNEGSFLNDLLSATALVHSDFYVVLEDLLNVAFIKDSFGDNLDKRVKEFGISRKEGKQSVGLVNIKGKVGTFIDSGTRMIANGLTYEVVDNQSGTINSESGIDLYIRAIEVGVSGNTRNDTIFELEEPNGDITSIVSVGNISGGINEETDDELRERFFYLQEHKGTSGNIDDYVRWALDIEGVKNVRVVPLWNGNGTVKVVVMTENNRNVDPSVVTHVKEYIDVKKPIGANVTVVTPTVLEININAVLEVDSTFDIENIKRDIRDNVDKYLSESVKEITYTKIAGIISSIYGVIDYKNLTVNGSTNNIKLQGEQVGSVGTLNISKGSVD